MHSGGIVYTGHHLGLAEYYHYLGLGGGGLFSSIVCNFSDLRKFENLK